MKAEQIASYFALATIVASVLGGGYLMFDALHGAQEHIATKFVTGLAFVALGIVGGAVRAKALA